MEKDFHKRLEGISENACHCTQCTLSECRANRIRCPKFRNYRTGITDGFQLGYKEAINVAKEWMKENAHDYSFSNEGCDALLADFENDMSKLLEDEK